MKIELYGKKGCKLCMAAEKKLNIMELPYEKLDIEHYSETHEGWRNDGSVDVKALHCLINMRIPMILINGKPYEYTAAMKELKRLKKEGA